MYLQIKNNVAELPAKISKELADLEATIKAAKQREDEIKSALLEEMEKAGVLVVETDQVRIAYTRGGDREALDTKSLRKDLPDIYDTYVVFQKVKPSLRITVK